MKTTSRKAAILRLVSTANIGAGSDGYRAGGGLGKCKSWSLSIQDWWWVLQVKKLVAKHMELEVKTTSRGLQ